MEYALGKLGLTGLKATNYGKPGHEHRITGTFHTDGTAASKQLLSYRSKKQVSAAEADKAVSGLKGRKTLLGTCWA